MRKIELHTLLLTLSLGCGVSESVEPPTGGAGPDLGAAEPDAGAESDAGPDLGDDPVDMGDDVLPDMGPSMDLGVEADMGVPDAGMPTGPTFTEDLYPIFEGFGCTTAACHGSFLAQGGFAFLMSDPRTAFEDALDRRSIREPLAIVEPGLPAQSVLFTHGRDANLPMGDLDEAGLALMETWIAAGAPFGPAPEPPPPHEPALCTFEGSSGFPPLPEACLPRCSASTFDQLSACTTTTCQAQVLDADTTPPTQLDLVTDVAAVDCGGCFDWQTQSCFKDVCQTELLGWQRCRFLGGAAGCDAEFAALTTCGANDPAFDACRSERLLRCAFP